ncbi:SSI family serine proteinase inhibitor [Streptomyces sp. NPDC014889]|uniref:SSI family serine proteinase inhibitor n=1 Tax=Streptomyces sp. NPDC014889 TaxID=3364928 RepID=UPI0037011707
MTTHPTKAATARLRHGLTAAAALLLAGAGAAPAAAAHRPAAQSDWLYVTVTDGDGRSGNVRGALLLCDPPRGHAHASDACTQLRSSGGDIHGLPHRDVLCPMIYRPVTAHARGQWKGHPVDYTETFSNSCEMTARTGVVFDVAP